MTRRDSTLCFFTIALLLLIGVLLLSSPTFAQDPIPTSADPSSAEQETLDLEVTVTGDNFGKDSVVEFLVTGTENPGGIEVKKVKSLGPQKLKVTVDVEADAVVDDFDIRVMSRGRTGKGTELFRVLEKEHPTKDTTPPGVVSVEYVGTEYNQVFLQWIAPADDGFDAGSGPASLYLARCVPGDVTFDPQVWDEADHLSGLAFWFEPGPPGTPEQGWAYKWTDPGFRPASTYSLAMRVRDEVPNESDISNTVTFTTQPYGPNPDWVVQKVPIPVSGLLGNAFDSGGNLVIAALYQDQIRILSGSWSDTEGQWQWDFEDVPGFADSFAIDPFGVPAFAWTQTLTSTTADVLYTYFDGGEWSTELVGSADGDVRVPARIAFDLLGNPAIAYYHWDNASDGGVKLARRSVSGQWSIELADLFEASREGLVDLAFDPAGNPAMAYAVYPPDDDDPYSLRLASLADGTWQVEEVDVSGTRSYPRGQAVQLSYDASRGEFAVLHYFYAKANYCERDNGSWQCEEPFAGEPPDYSFGTASPDSIPYTVPLWLTIDGAGEVFIPFNLGRSMRLARRSAAGAWNEEFIDSAWLWPDFEQAPFGVSGFGPFVALDPSGSPTLSWTWNRDDWQPGDLSLYFAWMDPTANFCGDGTCTRAETQCSCPSDCGEETFDEQALCSDFSDNDCDGVMDCSDFDCEGDAACSGSSCVARGEICFSNAECCSQRCHPVKHTCQ
ncbi:MAG: hypothetical protein WBO69_04760 [Thermoanaerobaculia bacterium]